MLISRKVKIRWHPLTKKHYEDKGYIYTKMKDEFEVKTEDLTYGSNVLVDIECDVCKQILKNISWQTYKECVHEDGKYYCNKCSMKAYGTRNSIKGKLAKGKSFEQWCADNNRQDILNRWDFEKNKGINPSDICYTTRIKYWIKCPKGLHSSELKRINNFVNGSEGSMRCNQCNSFEQWCIDNNHQDTLDRWDYKLNKYSPIDISVCSDRKYYFICNNKVHKSEEKRISDLTNGRGSLTCKQCNSFAQWGIDNLGHDFLEKYWDYEKNDKNKIDPWNIDRRSDKAIWIKCQKKEYHESYKTTCDKFVSGRGCPYCSGKGGKSIHILDSLGVLNPISLEVWSTKNTTSPFSIFSSSHKEVWWKCPDGFHQDYKRSVKSSKNYDFRCPECQHSKGEVFISNLLTNEEIKYIPQKSFDGLVGLSGGVLWFDFYLPQSSIAIEYDGEYHYKPIANYKNEPIKYAEERLKRQQYHDNLKDEFCKQNNIKLIRIPYWEFDNIEQILKDNQVI